MEYAMSPVVVLQPPPEQVIRGYAGFWRRLAAYIIDALILDFCLVPIEVSLGLFKNIPLILNTLRTNPDSHLLDSYLWLDWIFVIIWWLYASIMESSRLQATVGKLALGIIVTDERGNRINFGRA